MNWDDWTERLDRMDLRRITSRPPILTTRPTLSGKLRMAPGWRRSCQGSMTNPSEWISLRGTVNSPVRLCQTRPCGLKPIQRRAGDRGVCNREPSVRLSTGTLRFQPGQTIQWLPLILEPGLTDSGRSHCGMR